MKYSNIQQPRKDAFIRKLNQSKAQIPHCTCYNFMLRKTWYQRRNLYTNGGDV